MKPHFGGIPFGFIRQKLVALAVAVLPEVLLDGICVIQGMIKDGTKGVTIAVLPEECRPRQRLVFNLNVREYTGRVDVQADGSIIFVDSADWKTAWLSLTGISFAV